MATLPFNVQARTLRPGAGYIAWNAAGSVFNVKRDATSKSWRATGTRHARILFASSLKALAAKLDHDASGPSDVVPCAPVAPLYLSWTDGGARDRAETSYLA